MKYDLVGYDKDNDIYEVIEESEDLEYLKLKGKDIAEIQKDTEGFRVNGNGEPYDWFEIVQSDNYDVLYWVSYKTEITRDRLSEFFTPTLNWHRNDGKIIDYAEIEINPDGIKKLEENLDRCIGKDVFLEEEFKELNDVNSDIWEDVVCYVHFESGTEKLNNIYLSIRTSQDEAEIEADKILTIEEKHIITNYALELIRKVRD